MSTARRVVFPVIRMVIWGVIAVALCVIAFGRPADSATDTAPGGSPDAHFSDSIITAELGSVQNLIEVSAQVQAVAATDVLAGTEGTAVYFAVSSGDRVERGAPLMTIRQSVEREPLERIDSEGNPVMISQPPLVTDRTVVAPASGAITVKASMNQSLGADEVVATIDAGEYFVSGDVPPTQLYRLLELPDEAEVTITDGPAPFNCTGLRLAPQGGGESGEPSTSLRCDIPTDVRVFPSLPATITLITDSATDVVVLPVTAVQGRFESGSVWVVDASDEPVETPVELGLTDGFQIEIVSGLNPGDQVLEFVPSQQPQYPDGGIGEDPYGDEYYEEEYLDDPELSEEEAEGFSDDTIEDDGEASVNGAPGIGVSDSAPVPVES